MKDRVTSHRGSAHRSRVSGLGYDWELRAPPGASTVAAGECTTMCRSPASARHRRERVAPAPDVDGKVAI